jgi:hypothetical protein
MKTKQMSKINYEDVPEQIRREPRKYPAFKMGLNFCEAMGINYTPRSKISGNLRINQRIAVKGFVTREDYTYLVGGSSGYPNTHYDNQDVVPPVPVKFSIDRGYETPFFWKFNLGNNRKGVLDFGLLMYKDEQEHVSGEYRDPIIAACKQKRTVSISERRNGIPYIGDKGRENVYAYLRMKLNLGSLTKEERASLLGMSQDIFRSQGIEDMVNSSINGKFENSILDVSLQGRDMAKQLGHYGAFDLKSSEYTRKYFDITKVDDVGPLIVKIESHTPVRLAGIRLSKENEQRLESIATAFGEIVQEKRRFLGQNI